MATISRNDVVCTDYARKLIQVKARQLCRQYGFSRLDEEDLQQEMYLHLLRQAEQFNPQRASLNTFIDRTVSSCISMILRNRSRQVRSINYNILSLESTMIESDGKPVSARQAVSEDDLSRRTGRMAISETAGQENAKSPQRQSPRLAIDWRENRFVNSS